MKESDIQKAIFDYCKLIHIDKSVIHIPNQQLSFSSRSNNCWGYWRNLKDMGFNKGASDLLIAVPTTIYHGLFLEVKSKGKKPSKDQYAFLERMGNFGYLATWTDKIEEGISIIRDYLKDV